MKLSVHEWHPLHKKRTALLLHGLGSAATIWHRIAEHLVDLGYHVIAPELSGHGQSHRHPDGYSIQLWLQELRETLLEYPEPDLIIGHSLGGLLATGIADQYANNPRVIAIDPAWALPSGPLAYLAKRSLLKMKKYTSASIHRSKPTWSGRDINIELASYRCWDHTSVHALSGKVCRSMLKRYLLTPGHMTTVVRPRSSLLVTLPHALLLRARGVHIITLTKLTHHLHRDDYNRFFRAVDFLLNPI